jgi:sugar phosphate isomerase/epimerase
MTDTRISRRALLGGTAALAATVLPTAADENPPAEPFRYMLNTSTIRGQKLSLPEEIAIASKAGYHAIEPWISELDQFAKDGGNLKDLGKRIRDVGLTVESSIGFAEWIVDDDARRKKGLEQARRDLELVQQIGGKRMAAPPAGARDQAGLDLLKAAERYRALAEVADSFGIVPMVEFWGPAKSISRFGEATLVAMESGYPKACVLADVYHLYKGGSGFAGLNLVGPQTIQVIHTNDYPATPARDKITDADRVYPGDGVAPLKDVFRDLHRAGFRGHLSVELFNRKYWMQDAMVVARTGLEKARAVVREAMHMG